MYNNHIIWILWGMWPYASLRAYRLLLEISKSYSNWWENHDFPHILIDNIPVQSLIDTTVSVAETVRQVQKEYMRLRNAGADIVLMACNTMHLYSGEIYGKEHLSCTRILSLVDQIEQYIGYIWHKKIWILWSLRTIESGLYETWFSKIGVEVLTPLPTERYRINEIIEVVIAWTPLSSEDTRFLGNLLCHYKEEWCESVILWCSELPIAFENMTSPVPLYDPLEITLKKACQLYYAD